MIEVTFHLEAAIKPKGKINGVNLIIKAQMPIVPTVGMQVAAVDGDDFRKIEELYWSPAEGLVAYLEFEENEHMFPVLRDLGWKEEP